MDRSNRLFVGKEQAHFLRCNISACEPPRTLQEAFCFTGHTKLPFTISDLSHRILAALAELAALVGLVALGAHGWARGVSGLGGPSGLSGARGARSCGRVGALVDTLVEHFCSGYSFEFVF